MIRKILHTIEKYIPFVVLTLIVIFIWLLPVMIIAGMLLYAFFRWD